MVGAPCVKTRNILFRTHTSLRREARSVVDVTHVQPVVTGVVAIFVSAGCHALSLSIHDCARNGGSAQKKGHTTDTYARVRLPMWHVVVCEVRRVKLCKSSIYFRDSCHNVSPPDLPPAPLLILVYRYPSTLEIVGVTIFDLRAIR